MGGMGRMAHLVEMGGTEGTGRRGKSDQKETQGPGGGGEIQDP